LGVKYAFLAVGVFALALLLLPCAALAESFTLPAKAVFLESWEYWDACVTPSDCWYHNFQNLYTPNSYLFYRVLIGPDGSKKMLDYGTTSDGVHNYYPVYYHSITASIPETHINLTEPGSYRVELKLITMRSEEHTSELQSPL
jgi:hypothetical protein